MDRTLYTKLKRIFQDTSVNVKEFCSLLYTENFVDATDVLCEFFEDNFPKLLHDEEFLADYLLFLRKLIKAVDNENDLFALKVLVDKSIKTVKNDVKEYNTNEKTKDSHYYYCSAYLSKLKDVLIDLEFKIDDYTEYEEYRIMYFIINKLKNPDYLFRFIELHPNFVNMRNRSGKLLFIELIEQFIANLSTMSDEDIKYYKRIFVMFLESDDLRLSNEELYNLLEILEKNKTNSNIKVKCHINFLVNEIDRHYEIINQDSRVNSISHCFRECPIEIIDRPHDERVDLTDVFSFSIDSMVAADKNKRLIDDAFSINDNGDGTFYICMHIPDVDYFVKKDSYTDKFMKGLGETVYKKDYKTPLVPYEIAEKCSLVAGEVRPTITIMVKVDASGNLLDIEFMKSLTKVNYNLTKRQAEIFMCNNNDKRLFLLNAAYDITSVMRKNRKENIGKRSKAFVIMDEINIFMDLAVADYFSKNGIVFPYKNYAGKRSVRNAEHVSICEEFNSNNNISEGGRNILYSVFDINNRVYYDTVNHGNKSFNGQAVGNVGNPLREYISLETDRLIKDVVISGEKNIAYWEDRIERDCIEYTETSAKIKQLHNRL